MQSAFLSLLVLVFGATTLYAKPPSSEPPQPAIVEITGEHACDGTAFSAYTVPVGSRLIITEWVMFETIASAARTIVTIQRDDQSHVIEMFTIGDLQRVSHSYVTGIEFTEETSVYLKCEQRPGNPRLFYELRGLLESP